MRLRRKIIFGITMAGLAFSGCTSIKETSSPTAFIPPTLVASPVPVSLPSPTVLLPTPTPTCENGLRFLEDLTVPDGSVIPGGREIDKRWLVQNTGTCNWNEKYRLKLIEGSAMGAPPAQSLFPARSRGQVTIQIIYTAPKEPGIYRSAWQAFDPQDQPFGDPIFIEIVVP